jgi:hypothetical protein
MDPLAERPVEEGATGPARPRWEPETQEVPPTPTSEPAASRPRVYGMALTHLLVPDRRRRCRGPAPRYRAVARATGWNYDHPEWTARRVSFGRKGSPAMRVRRTGGRARPRFRHMQPYGTGRPNPPGERAGCRRCSCLGQTVRRSRACQIGVSWVPVDHQSRPLLYETLQVPRLTSTVRWVAMSNTSSCLVPVRSE